MSSMRSAILNITLDCTDAGRVARFWAEVTGWPLHQEDPQPGHQEYSAGPPAGGGIRMYFVTVPEPKVAKNRMHLDVVPPGAQQQEIERLTGLGAAVSGAQPPGAGWVVMADPEGNEFCVEPGAG